ncbi:hypothetical protein VTK56DRAFT_3932 [Thermocarpiscus australiensis]
MNPLIVPPPTGVELCSYADFISGSGYSARSAGWVDSSVLTAWYVPDDSSLGSSMTSTCRGETSPLFARTPAKMRTKRPR